RSRKKSAEILLVPVLDLVLVLGPGRHSLASWFPSSEAARLVTKSPPVAEEFLSPPKINRPGWKSQMSSAQVGCPPLRTTCGRRRPGSSGQPDKIGAHTRGSDGRRAFLVAGRHSQSVRIHGT